MNALGNTASRLGVSPTLAAQLHRVPTSRTSSPQDLDEAQDASPSGALLARLRELAFAIPRSGMGDTHRRAG
jgi:hypothetical protein